MEALLSRRPRDAKKVSVTRYGRLRELREWFSYSSTRGLRVRWTLRELAQLQINISINLDIHSTMFVSFLLNSVIRSKCDWVRKAREVYLIYKEKTLSPLGKKDVTKLDDNYMIKLSLHLHQSPSIFLFVTIFQFHCHFFFPGPWRWFEFQTEVSGKFVAVYSSLCRQDHFADKTMTCDQPALLFPRPPTFVLFPKKKSPDRGAALGKAIFAFPSHVTVQVSQGHGIKMYYEIKYYHGIIV